MSARSIMTTAVIALAAVAVASRVQAIRSVVFAS